MKKTISSILLAIAFFAGYAQQSTHQLTGKVVDEQTNEPLIDATVKSGNLATKTNQTGEFTLKLITGKHKLLVSYIGYKNTEAEVEVKNKNLTVEIKLTKASLELQNLEISSIRANDKTPFAKTNLNKSDIAKLNQGYDIPVMLNQTPSLLVNSDAGNGVGYTYMRIRGTDATRINVTLNGIPYNDAESQGTFFVDLPDMASSLNSIQIQRGVGTSSNGTGAFGATVNLSTNELNENKYAEINNSFGSYNTYKNTIKFGTGLINNHFTVDGRFSQIKSDGYVDRASSNLQSYALSTAYIGVKSSLRFNIFSGKEKTYQAWNGIDSSKLVDNRTYNSSGTDKPGNPYDNETDNYTQKHYQLFHNQTINSNWSYNIAGFYTKGFGYYENYKADQKYTNYGVVGSVLSKTDLVRQQWLDNDFYGGIFSVQFKKKDDVVTFGGSLTNYKGNHNGQVIWAANGGFSPNQKYYNVDARKWERSSYIKLQHNLNNALSVYADVQYRFVEHDMKGFKYNPTLYVNRKFSFINPKLGVSFNKNNWQAFASYAMAAKEPNRDDFEAGIANQPKEETLHDFELGVSTKKSNYHFGVTAYYMSYKDQLVLTGKINDVGAYTRTNVDNSYRAGVELEGTYVFTKWLNISANLTLSKNKVKEFMEYADDYDNGGQVAIKHNNTDITLSPNVISSNSINFIVNKNLSINLIGKYVGKQYLDNTQTEARSLSSYYTQDIKLNWTINNKLFKETLLSLSVNNIFNKKYVASGYCYSYVYGGSFTTDKFYFPMAQTNFMLSLNIKL